MLWTVEELTQEPVPSGAPGETRTVAHIGGHFHAASRAEAEEILHAQYRPSRGGRLRVRQAWRLKNGVWA